MERKVVVTGDGSHTVFVPELDEPYHSTRGAVQESMHVFIKEGFHKIGKDHIRILEAGMGTGLNVILTLSEAHKQHKRIHYHAVEKYPLERDEYLSLNYESRVGTLPGEILRQLHEIPWGISTLLRPDFIIFKDRSDLRRMKPVGLYDLIYFDAFAPDKQPHLWSESVFRLISGATSPGGLLLTYSSKGLIRRRLQATGFRVERLPGPPGKREMLRAIRI